MSGDPRHNLEAVATALYGVRWQVELAEACTTTTRTVRRWHRDPACAPDWVWHRLKLVAERRRNACDAALATLAAPGFRLDGRPSSFETATPTILQSSAPVRDRAAAVARGRAIFEAGRPEPVVPPVREPAREALPIPDWLVPPAPEPVRAKAAPVRRVGPPESPRKRVGKSRREKLLAALTAVDVRVNDKIQVRDAHGKSHRALVLNSDPQKRLRLLPMSKGHGLRTGDLFDPSRFVRVVDRPGTGREEIPDAVPVAASDPAPSRPDADAVNREAWQARFGSNPGWDDLDDAHKADFLRDMEERRREREREAEDRRRHRERLASRHDLLPGLGLGDLKAGDEVLITYQSGSREARITRINRIGTPMFRSYRAGGRNAGGWDNEQPMRGEIFLGVISREAGRAE